MGIFHDLNFLLRQGLGATFLLDILAVKKLENAHIFDVWSLMRVTETAVLELSLE